MKYYLISDEKFGNTLHNEFKGVGGIYKLHCFKNRDRNEIITINRALGNDNDGVLYIGKAILFTNRVINLKKSLAYKSGAHICGRRYWREMNENLRLKFPYENLCVSLTPSENPDELEKEKIYDYCKIYGEPPPLNRFD